MKPIFIDTTPRRRPYKLQHDLLAFTLIAAALAVAFIPWAIVAYLEVM